MKRKSDEKITYPRHFTYKTMDQSQLMSHIKNVSNNNSDDSEETDEEDPLVSLPPGFFFFFFLLFVLCFFCL